MWLGFGLASRNGLVGGSIVLVMLSAYMRRVAAEEVMLVVHLGAACRDDMRETSRLLPGVYWVRPTSDARAVPSLQLLLPRAVCRTTV
jgi:protein-S-isoprenylcysteine O-methyltransferase Ste14